MGLNPNDWADRQGAFTKAYRDHPHEFPHRPVHVRWSRWPEEFVRDDRARGFMRPQPIRVFVWTSRSPEHRPPVLVVELAARSLPEGDHDADVVAVGELEVNGAMAFLFEDGPHFPIYNPKEPMFSRERW